LRSRLARLLLGVAALLAVTIGALWIRATWASATERNPAASTDGAVTQLFRTPEGRTVVRCSVVIDRPIDLVWKGMNDPSTYSGMFPAAGLTAEPLPDGRIHVSHPKSTAAGTWTVDLHLRRVETPARRALVWDDPSAEVPVNRGDWGVTPLGPDRTLLVALLDIEVARMPDVVLRNILLSREGAVLEAVARSF